MPSHNPEVIQETIPENQLSLEKLPKSIYGVNVPTEFNSSDGIKAQETKFANAVIQAKSHWN